MSGLFLGFWLGRRRVGVVLVTVLLLTLLVVNVGRVWAPPPPPPTFVPNPPIAGEPFTVSAFAPDGVIVLYPGPTCTGRGTLLGFSDPITGDYSFTLTLAAGTYCLADTVHIVPFTVISPPSTTTSGSHPVYVGAAFLAHKQYCTASPTHC